MKKEVGIDIGNYSLKLVELEDRKGHLMLTRCALSRVIDGDKKSALKNLLSSLKSIFKRVHVSLAGQSVIVRYIEVPPMKKEELKSAIKFEAEKYLPFNINESTIDCTMLDKTISGSQRVLLAAARKQDVEGLMELFKDFGIEIGIIDVDSFAFFNSFQRAKIEDKEETTYALINMGAKFSNMDIATGQGIYFTRDMLWGGADITARIKDVMGIDWEEAEALKQKPADKREGVVNIIMPTLEKLSSQIRMSFDYFETQFGKNVERLYISGGSSYLFNIVDFLKENLGIDIIMWDPLGGIALSGPADEARYFPAQFAVAVGLALRGLT
jgi:type IV pilus assembly protein PilM